MPAPHLSQEFLRSHSLHLQGSTENEARGPIHRDELTLFYFDGPESAAALPIVDLQKIAADDAHFPELAGDDGRVRRARAVRCDEGLCL